MRNSISLYCILSLVSAPAFAATLFVPDDYPTIQEAVDAAEAGDIIKVESGEYAGAYIQRPVIIEGSGQDTRIVAGNDYPFWPGEDAFDIFGQDAWPGFCPDYEECGADGTQIKDLLIEGIAWGAYVQGANDVEFSNLTVTDAFVGIDGIDADRLTVTGVNIIGTIHGITHWSGNTCMIVDNLISDFKAPGHANGIIAFGDDCLIEDNIVFHVGEQVCNETGEPCGLYNDEFYVGINVGPAATGNAVIDNQVTIAVSDSAPSGDGRLASYALSIQGPNNTFLDNDLRGIGVEGVCQISTQPLVLPYHFYYAGCVTLAPDTSMCSETWNPTGCNTFEDNKVAEY